MDLSGEWVQKKEKSEDSLVGQVVIWTSIDKADMERRWLERSILKEQSNNIAGQLFFEAKIPFDFLSG